LITHEYVEEYFRLYEQGKMKLNKERILLFNYLKEHVLIREDLYFDEKQIDQCVRYIEKWYFPLEPFQKFVIAFLFLKNKETERLFYRRILIMMGRGGGKNGLISGITNYLNSELHGIPRYNVSIIANSEDQAKTSFEEVYDTIDGNETLEKSFYLTKLRITNRVTKSWLRFRTSNAGTKDGGREGCIVFDEIHQYMDSKIVNVFKSGLGKVKHPREIYIGTDGYVREGFLDRMKNEAKDVLEGKDPDSNMFPFICKLDNPDQVDNEALWELANPMFCQPMSDYAINLYETVKEEYKDLAHDPSNREEFMTKRMNLPEEDLEKSVAPWEDILRTNQPVPDLEGMIGVGALDYASVRDFAACGILFKKEGKYIWKTHSFVNDDFLKKYKLKAPIREWEKEGLLTIVPGPIIQMRDIVDWFVGMRLRYGITEIVIDNFRLELVKTMLEEEGFEIVVIKNPKAASAKVSPRIETILANGELIFGDNPLMRWYTQNTLVKIDKFGNKSYEKKDEIRRKTDGFMAMVYAFWEADNVLEEDTDFMLADISF